MSGPHYYVFCDGSYHAQKNVGIGAILVLSSLEWQKTKKGNDFPIQTQVMPSDSISRIELMTALWALSDPKLQTVLPKEVELFTDCKTTSNLLGRREKLEARNFKSGRTGQLLSNGDLYAEFYKVYDKLKPQITWIKGHSRSSEQTEFQRVFSFVDKKARQVLREQT